MTTSESAIEVRGLRKTYGPVVAVDHVDFTVSEGEIFGVLGPNGSGKSTTVESIAGLRRPDGGTVRVLGLDPLADAVALKEVLGVQLQSAGLQPKLRVREALDLFASFYDDPRDSRELTERLGLTERLNHPWAKLSGGQQQRLAIALALIGRPKVALLDELTTGLDPHSRRQVWELIRDVRDEGATVLLVTHLMEEAQYLCDRIALVDRGRVVALDTPAGLIGRTAAPTVMTFQPSSDVDVKTILDLDGVADVAVRGDGGDSLQIVGDDRGVLEVLTWLHEHGIAPQRLRVAESSLDEAYLDLITTADEEAVR